jgi:tetratricopeptide (TPR) repeat protein
MRTASNLLIFIIFGLLLDGCASSRLQVIEQNMMQKDWLKARKNLEESLRKNPRDGEALLLLAEVYGELNQAEQLVETLETLHDLSPKYHDECDYIAGKYWSRNVEIGVKQFDVGSYSEAIISFYNAYTIDSQNYDVLQKYADALFMTARYNEAGKAYERILQLYPQNLIVKNNLAEVYFTQKEYQKTIDLCSEILNDEPGNHNALMRRAYCYDVIGETIRAEKDYATLLKVDDSPQFVTSVGLFYFKNHNYEKAITHFQMALETTPDNLLLYRYLGEASWRVHDYQTMAQCYQQIVNSYPNDLTGWKNLAIAYEALGRTQLLTEARLQINKIISTN